jgi:putative tryptophan/tyrosine transport system substrate-binding protein
MRRREFITLVGGAAVAWALPAQAQQPAPTLRRLGYLFSFAPAEGNHLWEACRLGLRQFGYLEGRGIVLEPRWADGHHERLPSLAAELVRLKVDIIIAAATPATLAAMAATQEIPIVMVGIGDPVTSGLIASLARPGGNVTGLSLMAAELSGKRLELLAKLMSSVPRVAVVINPENPAHSVYLDQTRAVALDKGVELQSFKARNPREIEDVFAEALRNRIAALIVFDDPVIWSHRVQIVGLAAKQNLPVIYGYREFVDAGGLMSYGPDRVAHYRRSAYYVDKILRGTKPADMPVEQPTKFDLIVNLKTARALGLTVPQSLLATADEVVE